MADRDSPVVIGLDVGTTNIKAIAVDAEGGVLAEASRPTATTAPRPGWVEQDAEAMFDTLVACGRTAIEALGRSPAGIAAIGLANHTETLVVWDRQSGRAALPAILWQCRRGSAELEPLRTPDRLAAIRARTGIDLDPTFTASKLRWIAINRPDIAAGLREGRLLFGTVDSWLAWRLTGGRAYATEPGNASRTMLFDIDRLRFDPELFELFGLDIAHVPECRSSAAHFGETQADIFGASIPVRALLGDQQAALFGLGCLREGDLKATYGTGAFLWMNAGRAARETPPGLVRTVAWDIDGPVYAFEGFVLYAGRILDWLAGRLAVEDGAGGIAAAAQASGESAGVILVPAFQGLASPWWQPEVRAAILGLSEASGVGHIAHAGLEAVCFQIRAALEPLRDAGLSPASMRVDGGLTRSRYLLSLQADTLRLPLERMATSSAAAFGAALMAGLGAGVWGGLGEIARLIPAGERIEPDAAAAERLDTRYAHWLGAIDTLIAAYGRRPS